MASPTCTVQNLGAIYTLQEPLDLQGTVGFSLILRKSVAPGRRKQSIIGERTRIQDTDEQT